MPYTAKQKAFFGLCSSPRGRARARSKCPSIGDAKKLAHEAATLPTKRAKKHRR